MSDDFPETTDEELSGNGPPEDLAQKTVYEFDEQELMRLEWSSPEERQRLIDSIEDAGMKKAFWERLYERKRIKFQDYYRLSYRYRHNVTAAYLGIPPDSDCQLHFLNSSQEFFRLSQDWILQESLTGLMHTWVDADVPENAAGEQDHNLLGCAKGVLGEATVLSTLARDDHMGAEFGRKLLLESAYRLRCYLTILLLDDPDMDVHAVVQDLLAHWYCFSCKSEGIEIPSKFIALLSAEQQARLAVIDHEDGDGIRRRMAANIAKAYRAEDDLDAELNSLVSGIPWDLESENDRLRFEYKKTVDKVFKYRRKYLPSLAKYLETIGGIPSLTKILLSCPSGEPFQAGFNEFRKSMEAQPVRILRLESRIKENLLDLVKSAPASGIAAEYAMDGFKLGLRPRIIHDYIVPCGKFTG